MNTTTKPNDKGEPAVLLPVDLRDYFAAKALGAILDQKDVHVGREIDNAAWIAYQVADAMLEARK